jgi:hypothetical protein
VRHLKVRAARIGPVRRTDRPCTPCSGTRSIIRNIRHDTRRSSNRNNTRIRDSNLQFHR